MRRVIRLSLIAMYIIMASCSDNGSTEPGDPIIDGTASGKVVIPPGSSISITGMTVTTLEDELNVGADGSYSAKIRTQHARPTLVVASNANGEPVLMAFTRGNGTTDLDVTSTAAALAALAINIVPLDAALRTAADDAIKAHTEFATLKAAIASAMTDEPTSPLTGTKMDAIMAIAASISNDVFADLDLPKTMAVRQPEAKKGETGDDRTAAGNDWRSYISIEDDAGHNQPDVFVKNHSMAWYKVNVTRDGSPLEGSPFLVERNKLYTYHWNNWVSGGNNKTLKPGDGLLAFDLQVDREMTILDPFVSACIGMVGLTGNFDMVKMKGCMDAVSANLSLINELAKVGERWRYSNYNTSEYVSELAGAVWQDAPLLAIGIYDCLSKQVSNQAAKSLTAKIAKVAGSKAFGYMLMGAYGADISSAVWSAVNAQPGQERGRQLNGRYPAVAVEITPTSANGEECKELSYTAKYDDKVITGYPSFEWVITGPKTHWVSNTGSSPTLKIGSFPEPGLFSIVCNVSGYDDTWKLEVKGSGRATAQISPCNIPNLLVITPQTMTGRPGKQYSWTVSGGGGFITPPRYRWTFGDNTPPFESDGLSASHTYATEGTYAVRVEAIDMSERDAYRGLIRGYGTATAEIKRPDCSGNNGSVAGQWPPTGEFNGMSISYAFTGGALDSVQDIYDFHTRRNYVGLVGTGTMTLSGTFKSEWSPKVWLTVRVSAGDVTTDTVIVHDTYTPWQQSFSVSLNIPRGATVGSFTINAGAAYGNGENRGLSVNGTMKCGED